MVRAKKVKTGGDEDSEKSEKKTWCRKLNDTIEFLENRACQDTGKRVAGQRAPTGNREAEIWEYDDESNSATTTAKTSVTTATSSTTV